MSEFTHRDGVNKIGVRREGAQLLQLIHCFLGESSSNLWLRGGEMLVQKPLVLGGKVNQSCYCWADFVTRRREEGGELMRV